MKPSIKRLVKDQLGLRKSLPPNYFFEDTDTGASLPDDLTQLSICLAGPDGTPYSQGVWHVRLDIPMSYPQNPPTAIFQTRIFHPNVAEESGAVCLETLKRDWDPKLTLKDILVTILCLLIQPNPDSALNQKAGALIQDDYDAFARQARLMTKIHAPTPVHLLGTAQDAKRRGEDNEADSRQKIPQEPLRSNKVEKSEIAGHTKDEPSQENNVVKAGHEISRKRSLPGFAPCPDDPENLDNLSAARRKSPRYEAIISDPHDLDFSNHEATTCSSKATEKDVLRKDPPNPGKVIFRAHWNLLPGTLRTRARVGIRRL